MKAEIGKSTAHHSAEETLRLLHELQVHQIELEMQNAELRLTQETLELSRNMYAELYDFAPVGYFTIDAQGLIEGVNLKGAHLLGIERGLLLKRPFKVIITKLRQIRLLRFRTLTARSPGRSASFLESHPFQNYML
jgi:PAS domain-containing protein